MATHSVVPVSHLDAYWILAPERYDPRRAVPGRFTTTIGDVVETVAESVDRRKADPSGRYIVLDTGDAQEGVIRIRKELVGVEGIGSSKKRVQPGDVIISKLRPYLRQVAWLDEPLFNEIHGPADVLVSTEFFVLRAVDKKSIAFLVPLLLSAPVQQALSAAQEGGHHPRFNQRTLEAIGIPDVVLADRCRWSADVEAQVTLARRADLAFRGLVSTFSEMSRQSSVT